MDELIRLLEEATRELVDRIGEADFEELEAYVEFRERIVVGMQQWERNNEVLPRHRQAIAELGAYNKQIVAKMTLLRNEASMKLRQLTQAQTHRTAYDAEQPVDSFFFDKRK